MTGRTGVLDQDTPLGTGTLQPSPAGEGQAYGISGPCQGPLSLGDVSRCTGSHTPVRSIITLSWSDGSMCSPKEQASDGLVFTGPYHTGGCLYRDTLPRVPALQGRLYRDAFSRACDTR